MKFTVKNSVKSTLGTLAALSLLTGCGFSKNDHSSLRSEQTAKLDTDSGVLFAALESAGLKPDTIDGQVVYGAVNFSAENIYCIDMITSTVCGVLTPETKSEVQDASLNKKLIKLLSRVGKKADEPLYAGSKQYELSKVECSKGVYPEAKAECRIGLSKEDAAIAFQSLESAGVKPATADGKPVFGAVNISAESLYCIGLDDPKTDKTTKVCGAQTSTTKSEVESIEVTAQLFAVVSRLAEKSHEPLISGSSQYSILGVECSLGVYPGAEPTCSIQAGK